jgi:hypothetical protein
LALAGARTELPATDSFAAGLPGDAIATLGIASAAIAAMPASRFIKIFICFPRFAAASATIVCFF